MNSLENGRYRLVRKTFIWLVSIKEERVLFQSNKELKRNVIFFAGVGAVLLILMMLKWLPISADLEMALILFGLGILFYLKRVLREEEIHKS